MASPDFVLKLVRDYVTDYTSLLQGLLKASTADQFILPPGCYPVTSLTVPVGMTLHLSKGATIQALDTPKVGGNPVPLLSMSSHSRLEGRGSIDGNRTVRRHGAGIFLGWATGASVAGIGVRETAEQGVQIVGSTGITLDTLSITNCGATGLPVTEQAHLQHQAVNIVISQDISVLRSLINDAQHGVQWWGDGANLCQNLVIAQNKVSNVVGGIWGNLGKLVSVVQNQIDTCSDVGVDFEESFDSESIRNTVTNCKNHALSVFNGCRNIVFRGDTVFQAAEFGAGIGLYGAKANTGIRFESGQIETNGPTGAGLETVGSSVGRDITLTDYSLVVRHATPMPIRVLESDRFFIVENRLISGSHPVAVSLEGSSDSVVRKNLLRRLAPTTEPETRGVFLFWRDPEHPTKRTVVELNTLEGYEQIADDCWGDNDSRNTISGNQVARVTHRGTSGYTGKIMGNRTVGGQTSAVATI